MRFVSQSLFTSVLVVLTNTLLFAQQVTLQPCVEVYGTVNGQQLGNSTRLFEPDPTSSNATVTKEEH
jgi:hypothetical protein